jgi:hypothetical protein
MFLRYEDEINELSFSDDRILTNCLEYIAQGNETLRVDNWAGTYIISLFTLYLSPRGLQCILARFDRSISKSSSEE